MTTTSVIPERETDQIVDDTWKVIVWDDPVNTMEYVVYVFRKLFGYDKIKATRLMLEVHNDGKSVVTDGTREKAEHDCYRLHHHGLWATIEQ
jgi:ATP-dependent Clp protease adaptor protein ClpS